MPSNGTAILDPDQMSSVGHVTTFHANTYNEVPFILRVIFKEGRMSDAVVVDGHMFILTRQRASTPTSLQRVISFET